MKFAFDPPNKYISQIVVHVGELQQFLSSVQKEEKQRLKLYLENG